MDKGIFVEIIQYIGLLTTAIFGFISAERGKRIKEMKVVKQDLRDSLYDVRLLRVKEVFNLRRFSILEKEIKRLLYNTRIDRFTILFVMNGKTDFDYLTVLFDQILGAEGGGVSAYNKFKVDDIYKATIKEIELHKYKWIDTRQNFGIVGEEFRIEGIYEALFNFVERVRIDSFNDVILYSVASTHSPRKLTEKERRVIQLITRQKIKPMVQEIISLEIKDNL